jgi:hypothetical protein
MQSRMECHKGSGPMDPNRKAKPMAGLLFIILIYVYVLEINLPESNISLYISYCNDSTEDPIPD